MQFDEVPGAVGRYEGTARLRVLPACGRCGEKHPRAMKPTPVNLEICPRCGAHAEPPSAEIDVPALVADTRLRFGIFLTKVGRYLNGLAKGI